MSFPCTVCAHANVEEINRSILAHTPLREIASRVPGTTRSALGRHRKHVGGLLARAVARIAAPPPDSREIERYENNIYAQSIRLITEKRGLYETQLAAGDFRGASQTHQQLVDYIRWQHGLLPSNEDTPGVEVRYVFDTPEDQRRAESLGRGEAATGRTPDAATSGMSSDIEVSQRLVAHEESDAAPVEPASMLGPIDITIRTFDPPPVEPSADAMRRAAFLRNVDE
jgi:hypothetical protein